MIILGVDTTTYHGSMALYDENRGLLASVNLLSPESHSRRLLPTLHWLLHQLSLEPSSLGGLAVACGPGSFTGLRIGISTVQGLATGLNIPAAGISTLEAMALKPMVADGLACPMLDARRGEIYSSLYRTGKDGKIAETLIEPAVVQPGRFMEHLSAKTREYGAGQVVFCGDGALAYEELLASTRPFECRLVSGDDLFIGVQVARIGLDRLAQGAEQCDPAALTAIYLRPSDAELSVKPREDDSNHATSV